MSKIRKIIANPFLLGVQGFVIGAALLWSSGNAPTTTIQAPAVTGASLIAPSASTS